MPRALFTGPADDYAAWAASVPVGRRQRKLKKALEKAQTAKSAAWREIYAARASALSALLNGEAPPRAAAHAARVVSARPVSVAVRPLPTPEPGTLRAAPVREGFRVKFLTACGGEYHPDAFGLGVLGDRDANFATLAEAEKGVAHFRERHVLASGCVGHCVRRDLGAWGEARMW